MLTKTSFSMIADFDVNVMEFIPPAERDAIRDRTSTYDCYNDIVAAIDSVTFAEVGTYKQGPVVYFPPGKYNCGSTFNLKRTVTLKGDNSGQSFTFGAELFFASGVAGFIVNAYNTLGNGIESPGTFGADGTVFDGIRIIGDGGTTANGIWMRARCIIRNCQISSFSGLGVKILASAGGSASTEGNANLWTIQESTITANGSHGIYIDGADVNAGIAYKVDCSNNGGFGIWDSSFLGNTYIACHAADNTSGAYKTDDSNAKNLFLGCYSESGQPTSSMVFPTQVVGGLHAAGIAGNFIDSREYPTIVQGVATATTGQSTMAAFGNLGSNVLSLTSSDESSFPFTLRYKTGRWEIDWAGSAQHFFLYNQKATVLNGYARDLSSVNGALGIPAHYSGSISQMKYRGLSTAAPASGTWAVGDIVFNESPTAGGYIGWVCTTAGTPGTWKTFGAITP